MTTVPSRLGDLPGTAVPDRRRARSGRRALGAARRAGDRVGCHAVQRHRARHRSTARPHRGQAESARGRGRHRTCAVPERTAARRVPAHASGQALIPVLDALLEWGKEHAVAPDDPDRQHRYPPMTKRRRHRDRRTGRHRHPKPTGGRSARRIVTWHDPGPTTAKGLTMAGIDYLRAMVDGDPAAAADRRSDGVRDGRRRSGPRRIHLRSRRIRLQPDRRHPRRARLHAARLGDRAARCTARFRRARATPRWRSR